MDDMRHELEVLKQCVDKLQSTAYKEYSELHTQDFILGSRIKELQEEILKLKAAIDRAMHE